MYEIRDSYLNEVMEDYKNGSDEEKEFIFDAFTNAIWSCGNRRNFNTRSITYYVDEQFRDTDIGKLFEKYSAIEYEKPRSRTEFDDYINLIRQRINNLYNIYCEPRACYTDECVSMLRIPSRLYVHYRDNPELYSYEEIEKQIHDALKLADELKAKARREKLNITWDEYKELVNGFIYSIFNSYKPLDYNNVSSNDISEFADEEHRAVRYLCKSLGGYMQNYQKEYYGITRRNRKQELARCACGNMFEQNKQHNRILCDQCRDRKRKESQKKYNKKRPKAVTIQLKSS